VIALMYRDQLIHIRVMRRTHRRSNECGNKVHTMAGFTRSEQIFVTLKAAYTKRRCFWRATHHSELLRASLVKLTASVVWWSEFLVAEPRWIVFTVRYERNLYMLCRRTLSLTRPPLWSSGQSSWLQIQRSGFDSRRYRIL
jgi:hypothetical protein